MRHTALPNTFLAEVCDQVAAMKPGERLAVDMHTLKSEIPSFYHNDTHFNPADRARELISDSDGAVESARRTAENTAEALARLVEGLHEKGKLTDTEVQHILDLHGYEAGV